MGAVYTATFDSVAVSALQDLFEITAPSSACVIVHDWHVFQTSDTGDTAEEILRLQTVRGDLAVASGSGGSTLTPQPLHNGDPAFGGTVECNNTTRMTAGSPDTLEITGNFGWNVRVPYDKVYTPETRPVISPGKRWALALPVAPGDPLTMGATITFEVIGG